LLISGKRKDLLGWKGENQKKKQDVPTQGLVAMGINTLKQDGSKVKSSSKKGKATKEEELLS
jgi:hypothetical protein